MVGMIRYLFRCTAEGCGNIWANDYAEPVSRTAKPKRTFLRAGIPITMSPLGDKYNGCQKCRSHHQPMMSIVRGKLSASVKCDERCTQARTASCSCSCGGLNHGRAFLVSP